MGSPADTRLILSSEHGTNHVPRRYRSLFADVGALLDTHRGLDVGSSDLAVSLADQLGAPLHRAAVTRLLVDCNRSPGHPGLYSEFTRGLPSAEKDRLLASYYQAYRDGVESEVRQSIAHGWRVLHVSVHSFTRTLDGVVRNADIGLLYDPARTVEKNLCVRWQFLLRTHGGFRVRRNYPYRGVADGLVTWLRRRFPAAEYSGVELEVCQDLAEADGRCWEDLKRLLGASLRRLLTDPV